MDSGGAGSVCIRKHSAKGAGEIKLMPLVENALLGFLVWVTKLTFLIKKQDISKDYESRFSGEIEPHVG